MAVLTTLPTKKLSTGCLLPCSTIITTDFGIRDWKCLWLQLDRPRGAIVALRILHALKVCYVNKYVFDVANSGSTVPTFSFALNDIYKAQ